VRYAVVAPTIVVSQPRAAVKITSAKAKRAGKTVTLTLRGTVTRAGSVKVTALGHAKAAKVVGGRWTLTLKLKTTAKRVKVSVAHAGVRAQRTVTVR
jgi:hypothetical protein